MNSILSICKIQPEIIYNYVYGTLYQGSWTWQGNTYTKIYVFDDTNNLGIFSLNVDVSCGILIAGGGAAGGSTLSNLSAGGGGGGAGTLIYGTIKFIPNQNYTIKVGSAGTQGSAGSIGSNGNNSYVSGNGVSETAFGGGRAGYPGNTTTNSGGNGGSGGGSTLTSSTSPVVGQSTTSVINCSSSTVSRILNYMGNAGGLGVTPGSSGGGGGATQVGQTGSNVNNDTIASRGGIGFLFDASGTSIPYINVYYCHGGSGGARGGSVGPNYTSFISIGGAGGGKSATPQPLPPTSYGSGGGGCYGNTSNAGGAGSQGIVLILVP